MAKEHYVGMSGLRGGYLPNYCQAYETRAAAVEGLAELHELAKYKTRALNRYGWIELPNTNHNESAEVCPCSCEAPWEHSETDTEEDWADWLESSVSE